MEYLVLDLTTTHPHPTARPSYTCDLLQMRGHTEKFCFLFICGVSRGTGIATGWTAWVQVPAGATLPYIFLNVQSGNEAHLASYKMRT
jgi:hypothetical protein